MKNMKFGFIGALAIATSMFFAGCADECKDVVCNNGECVTGECVCDAGYETDDCSVAFNAKFSGTYALSETCSQTGTDNYSVSVAPSTIGPDRATITGLYREAQASVPAVIAADGVSFTLTSTDIGPGSVVSSGTCSSNAGGTSITVVYTFTNETTQASETCTAVLTRQ